jgi:hypothetical protein
MLGSSSDAFEVNKSDPNHVGCDGFMQGQSSAANVGAGTTLHEEVPQFHAMSKGDIWSKAIMIAFKAIATPTYFAFTQSNMITRCPSLIHIIAGGASTTNLVFTASLAWSHSTNSFRVRLQKSACAVHPQSEQNCLPSRCQCGGQNDCEALPLDALAVPGASLAPPRTVVSPLQSPRSKPPRVQ